MSENVREREIAPLKSVTDYYKRVILSMDKSFIKSDDGIQLKNIVDFLLEN